MTKDELLEYGKLVDRLRMLRAASESADFVKASNISPMPKGSASGTQIEEFIEKQELLEESIKDVQKQLTECLNRIMRALYEVDDQRARVVIYQRYVRRLKWEEIAAVQRISIRQAHNLHKEGLEALANVEC